MTPIERIIYNYLINSPGFNNFVRNIHNKINRVPQKTIPNPGKITWYHKANAFRIIWLDELKSSFRIK